MFARCGRSLGNRCTGLTEGLQDRLCSVASSVVLTSGNDVLEHLQSFSAKEVENDNQRAS
jgi:hypothetical protein